MFSKEALFDNLSRLQPGEVAHVAGLVDRSIVQDAVREWCSRNSAEAGISTTPTGFEVKLAAIHNGSILRARRPKIWMGMLVNESRFLPMAQAPKAPTLRTYVSQHAAKVGQRISVTQAAGGYNITRFA